MSFYLKWKIILFLLIFSTLVLAEDDQIGSDVSKFLIKYKIILGSNQKVPNLVAIANVEEKTISKITKNQMRESIHFVDKVRNVQYFFEEPKIKGDICFLFFDNVLDAQKTAIKNFLFNCKNKKVETENYVVVKSKLGDIFMGLPIDEKNTGIDENNFTMFKYQHIVVVRNTNVVVLNLKDNEDYKVNVLNLAKKFDELID